MPTVGFDSRNKPITEDPPLLRPLLSGVVLALVAWLIMAWIVADVLTRRQLTEAISEAARHNRENAETVSLGVKNTLSVLHGIPASISRNAAIHRALRNMPAQKSSPSTNANPPLKLIKETPELVALNRSLAGSIKDFEAMSLVWVMDSAGYGIASSNAHTPGSTIGTYYADREYFREAMAGKLGQQFAVGRTTNTPGLFFSAPVIDNGKTLGVVTGKIDMSFLSSWMALAEAYMTDSYGVVVLARNKALEMRTVPGATVDQLTTIERQNRYKRTQFTELVLSEWGDPIRPLLTRQPSQPLLKQLEGWSVPVITQTVDVPGENLSLTVIQPVPAVVTLDRDRAQLFGFLAIIGTLLIGAAVGFLIYARSINRARAALLERQNRLSEAQQIAHIGSWKRDLLTDTLEWSDEAIAIFGGNELRILSYPEFIARLHPDDRERVRETAKRAIKQDKDYDVQYRVLLPNGELRHVHSRGKLIYGNGSKSIGMVGTVQDISERVATEALIREGEQTLRTAIEAIDEAFVLYDAQDRLVFCNEKFRQIYHLSADLFIPGETFSEIVRKGVARGQYPAATGRVEEWLAERIAQHQRGQTTIEQRLASGRWLRTVERKTPSGYIVGFRVDITELKQAKEAAEAANQAKGDFLANMSHEIRTPMNGIIGMNELLLQTDLGEEQREYAETVRHSAQALLGLINDILDFSKIEAGKLNIETIDFDLRVLIDEIGDFFALRAAEKRLELVCLVEPSVPSLVRGDPGRLRQILLNLVGNAVKFTSTGEVALLVSLLEESTDQVRLHIVVRDTGIGISEDKIGILFLPFTQADASTTRQYGGTGLGLSIARHLVELMGGEIGIDSQPGQGTTFWLDIPFALQAEEAYIAHRRKALQLVGHRVLVVDDNETNRRLLKFLLTDWQCVVLICCNAAQALETLSKEYAVGRHVDVMIIDMQMPVMDGETLGRRIKLTPELSGIPLVALTSMAMRGDAGRFADAGFSAYLSKPVTADHLQRCLQTVLSTGPSTEAGTGVRQLLTRHTLVEDDLHAHILLVEDNETNQKLARALLIKLGHRVEVVSNGAQALEALARENFDMVLMDCRMPVMDGYEATRAIRNAQAGVLDQAIPIIAMTANAMEGDRDKVLSAGMDDYLSKPIDPNLLAEKIRLWLGREIEKSDRLQKNDASTTAAVQVFNSAALIENMGNDLELLSKLLPELLDGIDVEIGKLREAMHTGDLPAMRRAVHTSKGLAGSAGGSLTRNVTRIIEEEIEAGRLANALTRLSDLEACARELRTTALSWLHTAPGFHKNH
jgi:two-component system sensor histidine kinase/response regulator